ncbi:MAG: Panacea domain-containing protein [Bacteroidetes bacterium]|nr:Panacea domain-containing protein [Bacteroidota bacterium]
MYKLLAEFDFRHFQETALPVTDLTYKAFQWGPLPENFHEEITKGDHLVLPEDFISALQVREESFTDQKGKEHEIFFYVAKRKADLKVFSPRQQKILRDVADIYKTATPTEASKASHEPGKPWTTTVMAKGERAAIDMLETVPLEKPLTKEIAKDKLREYEALLYNYGE